jgi:hypothetical protein
MWRDRFPARTASAPGIVTSRATGGGGSLRRFGGPARPLGGPRTEPARSGMSGLLAVRHGSPPAASRGAPPASPRTSARVAVGFHLCCHELPLVSPWAFTGGVADGGTRFVADVSRTGPCCEPARRTGPLLRTGPASRAEPATDPANRPSEPGRSADRSCEPGSRAEAVPRPEGGSGASEHRAGHGGPREAQRAFLVARLRGGVSRSAIWAIAVGTSR